jgi:hypothetical protein
MSRVNKFRDDISKPDLSIGLKSSDDAFARVNKAQHLAIRDSMLDATEGIDEARLDELVAHWIEFYHNLAYRELADATNTGSSHYMSIVRHMAKANAYHQTAEELASWRDYGIFEPSVEFRP